MANIVRPGTDKVVLATNVMDMMTCRDGHVTGNKMRYCIVHKNRTGLVYNQFTDAEGRPVSVVTQPVFEDVQAVITAAQRRIQDLEREVDLWKSKFEAYRMTVETLRKNGVID